MKFAEFVKAVRADGMKTLLFRGLFNLQILSIEEIGSLIERFGNLARADGLTFSMDTQLLHLICKGAIVLGCYENDELELILKHLPLDEPVIELGASIGFVSCMINRRLHSPDQHVVVEASPGLIPTLKKNRDINHSQFGIVEAAIGYGSATIPFFSHGSSMAGSIFDGGGQSLQVPTKTLQAIAENAGFGHFTLICDIEGSEIDLIAHEIDFIREHVGLILIEIHEETPHGEEGVNAVIETLQANGFEMIVRIDKYAASNYCFRNTTKYPAG